MLRGEYSHSCRCTGIGINVLLLRFVVTCNYAKLIRSLREIRHGSHVSVMYEMVLEIDSYLLNRCKLCTITFVHTMFLLAGKSMMKEQELNLCILVRNH
jgi:hypothetical protein